MKQVQRFSTDVRPLNRLERPAPATMAEHKQNSPAEQSEQMTKRSGLYRDINKSGKKISLDSFTLMNTLCVTQFGRVRLVKYGDEYFALKMQRKTRVVEFGLACQIRREQEILSSIRHP